VKRGAQNNINRRPKGIIIENGRTADANVWKDTISERPGASLSENVSPSKKLKPEH
jgi:hypothetical protein